MPELLELAQLVDENGVAKVQIRRGGVEARLDAQRLAALDSLAQIRLVNEVHRAPLQLAQLIVNTRRQSAWFSH